MLCLECCFLWLKDLGTKKLDRKYLESFAIGCWRIMGETKWSEKINNEVLERIGEKRTFLNNIVRRKAKCVGHIPRGNILLHDATKGQVTGVKVLEEDQNSLEI